MPVLSNLVEPSAEDMRQFVVAVVGLAVSDHAKGGKQYGRTGLEIVNLTSFRHRGFHRAMASGIYNKTILSLELRNSC